MFSQKDHSFYCDEIKNYATVKNVYSLINIFFQLLKLKNFKCKPRKYDRFYYT